jgi:hypothetical protein
LRFCGSRLEFIVADRNQKSNAFFAEAVPVTAAGPQHLTVITPYHQERSNLETTPKQ